VLTPDPSRSATLAPAPRPSVRAPLLLGAGVLTLSFAVLALLVAAAGGPTGVDRPVLTWTVAHRSGGWNAVEALATALGSGPFVVVITCAVAATLWWLRDRAGALAMVTLLAGAAVLTVAGKHLLARTRPPAATQVLPLETGFSFPSGHTLFAVSVWCGAAVLLSWHLRRRGSRVLLVTAGTLVAVGVGASRLYLGYHWLTDVLGALVLGTAWVLVCVALASALRPAPRAAAPAHAVAPPLALRG